MRNKIKIHEFFAMLLYSVKGMQFFGLKKKEKKGKRSTKLLSKSYFFPQLKILTAHCSDFYKVEQT